MARGDRRETRLPRGVVVRPVAMLVAGVGLGFVLWRVLTLEPSSARPTERITRGERAALERLLRSGPARSTP
jgi:hypothetical protein